jgi:hypothetical protein
VSGIAALALTACQPAPSSGGAAGEAGTAAPQALVPASVQPPVLAADCALPQAGLIAELCAVPATRAAAEALDRTMSSAIANLGNATRGEIFDTEVSWRAAVQLMCPAGTADPDPRIPGYDRADCLNDALEERRRAFVDMVDTAGPWRLVRISFVEARAVVPEGPDGFPNFAVRSVQYPRIDNADSAAAEAFNAAMRRGADADWRAFASDRDRTYTITYAGPAVISVAFRDFLMGHGAARPSTGGESVHFMMQGAGRALAAGDLFADRTAALPVLARRAAEGLNAEARDIGVDNLRFTPERLAPTVADPANWVLRREGLGVFVGADTVAPNAFGQHEILIPWADLRPLLRPDAPMSTG